MKRLWHRFVNNVLYYFSVIDVAVTGFLFHVIHFFKTGKLPQKRTRYSQKEILEEIRIIAKEQGDKAKAPVEGPGPKE